MNPFLRRVLFVLFLLSGFSSLVYQVVWTRLAFASFGIITPVLSVVLSVFMLGLAVGSWAGGRWIGPLVTRTGWSAAFFYAGAEFIIGLSAFAVPKLFLFGETVLLKSGETDSAGYLMLSAVVLGLAILPWCVCMGTTFPFMMAYIRERAGQQAKSFSFLYLANVLGAMSGTFLAAVVYIELLGFHHTLWLAAGANFTIAFISICLGLAPATANAAAPIERDWPVGEGSTAIGRQWPEGTLKWILFATGFIAMAMEVVWTRAFTPVLKTQVYSFALIVFTYLGATFCGSWVYRDDLKKGRLRSKAKMLGALAVLALFPVLINTPRLMVSFYWESFMHVRSGALLLASIVPFCAVLGYLTPGLIDEYAGGDPNRAGRAYAINVLGCILGPLAACYGLLPHISERYALILLALPFPYFFLRFRDQTLHRLNWMITGAVLAALLLALFGTQDFEDKWRKDQPETVVRRDYAATVISFGEGLNRNLLVNGFGMTSLTPITKFMVHLPMAFHQAPPKSILVICFGMGTSFRSAVSWNVDATVVELVPSVTKAFGFYHADAQQYINAPNGHIVIDDGRRFLRRTTKYFDVIVVDPPPPAQAAGSSLLFSSEFYELAKQHLAQGGIVQMWVPGNAREQTAQAALRSLTDHFAYVRCFKAFQNWGVHMLGSMEPIPLYDPVQLAARMPESARRDLMEWFDSTNVPVAFDSVLTRAFRPESALNPNPRVKITDDQPYNEYFLLRRLGIGN